MSSDGGRAALKRRSRHGAGPDPVVVLARAIKARNRARAALENANVELVKALARAVAAGLPQSEAAAMLGVTKQRVHTMLTEGNAARRS